jgi:hypothetical protein
MQKNLVDFLKQVNESTSPRVNESTGLQVYKSTDGAAFLSPDNGGTEGGAKTIEAKERAHFAESRQVSNEVQRVNRTFVAVLFGASFAR